MRLTTRPAKASDIECYPEYAGVSLKARICEVEGEPAGIIGIAFTRPYPSIFSDVSGVLRPHLKKLTVLRLVKWLKDEVEARRVAVRAFAEENEPTAPRVLAHLGFEPVGDYEGQMVYERRPD